MFINLGIKGRGAGGKTSCLVSQAKIESN